MPGSPVSRQRPESGRDPVTPVLRIDRLWIGHWPAPVTRVKPPASAAARAFVMETCLRRVMITADIEVARALSALRPPETFTASAGYRFLLEVATGLQSAIPGETNVFGQFKRAWESFRSVADQQAIGSLAGIVARTIRDTRTIRRQFLQHIGGASYGALARRLLQPRSGDRILFVGAGELARSMLPFFRGFDIGVWNRRPPGAAFAAAGRLFASGDGAIAAEWAHHIIMTTPVDQSNDECWARWLDASLVQTVLHLGHRRGNNLRGPTHAISYDLDDLFELRRSQSNIRSLQLERARLACQECARQAATPPPVREAAWRTATG